MRKIKLALLTALTTVSAAAASLAISPSSSQAAPIAATQCANTMCYLGDAGCQYEQNRHCYLISSGCAGFNYC